MKNTKEEFLTKSNHTKLSLNISYYNKNPSANNKEKKNVDKATFFSSGSNSAGAWVLNTLTRCNSNGINARNAKADHCQLDVIIK
tara:strand:+ start:673 stop:927 length:255 start_codon:yes stop_codon:yes gene_type:complete